VQNVISCSPLPTHGPSVEPRWSLFSSAIAAGRLHIILLLEMQDPHRFAAPLAKAFAFEVQCFGEPGMKNIHSQADQPTVASEVGNKSVQCLRRVFHPRNTRPSLVCSMNTMYENSCRGFCETSPRALISSCWNVLRRQKLLEIFKLPVCV